MEENKNPMTDFFMSLLADQEEKKVLSLILSDIDDEKQFEMLLEIDGKQGYKSND